MLDRERSISTIILGFAYILLQVTPWNFPLIRRSNRRWCKKICQLIIWTTLYRSKLYRSSDSTPSSGQSLATCPLLTMCPVPVRIFSFWACWLSVTVLCYYFSNLTIFNRKVDTLIMRNDKGLLWHFVWEIFPVFIQRVSLYCISNTGWGVIDVRIWNKEFRNSTTPFLILYLISYLRKYFKCISWTHRN